MTKMRNLVIKSYQRQGEDPNTEERGETKISNTQKDERRQKSLLKRMVEENIQW